MMPAALTWRTGHFVLESGLHTDRWFDLDRLLVDPAALAPAVAQLADALAPYRPTAICGPLVGGAFVAQQVATTMKVRFLFAQAVEPDAARSLFAARYRVPDGQRVLAARERIAIVDDMISAGSAVRAVRADLVALGATVAVVGALYLMGVEAAREFAAASIPFVAAERLPHNLWMPDACPLCNASVPHGGA